MPKQQALDEHHYPAQSARDLETVCYNDRVPGALVVLAVAIAINTTVVKTVGTEILAADVY